MTIIPSKKAPKLRFPQFQNAGDWEEKNIETILTIGSGKDYKHLSPGNIPVYGSGGYMLSVNDFLYDGDSVCIGRKGTINKPLFLKGKFWTVDTLFYTHSFRMSLPSFVYQVFQRINWNNYNEAGGVPSLSKTTIGQIPILIPSLPEQQKIADCLSSLDKLISLQGQKLDVLKQHKKGLMQQLFPAKGETVPRLRFPEFQHAGEWKVRKLEDIADVKGGKRIPKGCTFSPNKTPYPYIRVTDMYMGGINTSSILYIDDVVEQQIRNYKISKDDLFITVAGTIGIVGEVPAILDNANLTENANKIVIKNINKKFLLYTLTGTFIQNYIQSVITNNAQPKLALERIRMFPIKTPSLPEQQKIANCLSSLDEQIAAAALQLEALKQHKQGLMQQLFPSA